MIMRWVHEMGWWMWFFLVIWWVKNDGEKWIWWMVIWWGENGWTNYAPCPITTICDHMCANRNRSEPCLCCFCTSTSCCIVLDKPSISMVGGAVAQDDSATLQSEMLQVAPGQMKICFRCSALKAEWKYKLMRTTTMVLQGQAGCNCNMIIFSNFNKCTMFTSLQYTWTRSKLWCSAAGQTGYGRRAVKSFRAEHDSSTPEFHGNEVRCPPATFQTWSTTP